MAWLMIISFLIVYHSLNSNDAALQGEKNLDHQYRVEGELGAKFPHLE